MPAPTIARRIIASLSSAVAIALTAHLATIFVFVVANQLSSNAQLIPAVHDRFLASSLLLLIALFVFGFIGIFRTWYVALVTGLIFAIASALGGTTIYAASNGQAASVLDQLALLIGVNLPFVVAATLGAVFIGPRLTRRVLRPTDAAVAIARRVALVRVPADTLADGIVRSAERPAIDLDLANDQWDAYVSALLENGWSTIEVEPANTLADSVFVEDAAVVFGDTAVVTRPGAASRLAETPEVEASLAELGLRIERIAEPGTLDGGDVLKVGRTVYVGRGGRTNAEGIRQLRALLADTGHRVVAVPVTKVLHLKSAVTALPDGTVLGHPTTVDDPRVFERYLEVPEPEGAHVVVLAADAVLMAASAPRSAELVESLGYRVVTVDVSEFEKLDGCVTCLSIRIR
ncbi:arginine deiminase family protein [Galbitalea sp. SE-J8]|uniref:dimethylargininase n=1 Tax=Galbitalea sp. SE-J8 TaxID=3054952 RepID=UPI00259C8717|nr:dimethylargininase [Galbitalea sp. SE-J8]MDM4761407.1 arginine deiminase family protein [Galbitalea sp. SE-J8]